MAHLLPTAGVDLRLSDQFRFHQTTENLERANFYDDIPLNIHDYKWTDYVKEDATCRQGNRGGYSFQQDPGAGRMSFGSSNGQFQEIARHDVFSGEGGGGYQHGGMASRYRSILPADGNWGFCPPINVDPRSLIRPLDKSLPSSTRPTGAPYFAQESVPSCPPHRQPKAKKGGFNFQDWMATYNQRIPPEDLQGSCIPSLCRWCQPVYVDCCPDFTNPWAYTISKKIAPYYF